MEAGHGGGSGRTSSRSETAKEYAFLLNLEEIYS
jgi:protease II